MQLKQYIFPKVDQSEVTSERQQREMLSQALPSLFLCIRNASNCRKYIQKKCSAAEHCYSQRSYFHLQQPRGLSLFSFCRRIRKANFRSLLLSCGQVSGLMFCLEMVPEYERMTEREKDIL